MPQTCGGGGITNQCGCTAAVSCPNGQTCGSAPDGCGSTMNCGTCNMPQTCGGGSVANQCGCTPKATCAGKICGTDSDGCGNQVPCGTCNAGEQCTAAQRCARVTFTLRDSQGRVIGEYDSTGAPVHELVYLGNLPVASMTPTGLYTVQTDHLGTPRSLTNATGTVVWKWDSDVFGSAAPDEDPDGDAVKLSFNLRFPGQLYDVETGLHQNGFRDYDPSVGRYLEADPIGLRGGANVYSYVRGRPVSWVDPIGLDGEPQVGVRQASGTLALLIQIDTEARLRKEDPFAIVRKLRERPCSDQAALSNLDRYFYVRDNLRYALDHGDLLDAAQLIGVGLVGGWVDYALKSIDPNRGRSSASLSQPLWSTLGIVGALVGGGDPQTSATPQPSPDPWITGLP